jgi:hypothetical protein
MDAKGKWAAPIAVCAGLIALVAIYSVCYVRLSTPVQFQVMTMSGVKIHINRLYPHPLLAAMFWPASRVESFATGVETNTGAMAIER